MTTRHILVLIAFPALVIGQCSENKNKISTAGEQKETNAISQQLRDSLPLCIRQKIDDRKKEKAPNPPQQVDEYLYKGKKVFLFNEDCCDFFNELYDDSCRIICAPSGGITGRGDGKCSDFYKTARLVKVIWKNPK